MAIPFYKASTFTGLVSTKNYGTSEEWNRAYNTSTAYQNASGNWQDTYTFVQSNSASWNINNLDGGSSIAIYLANQTIDSGSSIVIYLANQTIDGGTSNTF